MRKTNIYEYYAFGYNYYLLRFENEGLPVHGAKNTLVARLGEFMGYVRDLDLQVTAKAAARFTEIHNRAKKLPKDATVDDKLAKEVTKAIDEIDTTLDAELKLRDAFIITPKRFELGHLLHSPKNLFANDVFSCCPRICRFDFGEACKSIAYALPTGAAFHLMRGVEGMLRFYYCTVVKRGRVKSLMWGQIIDHLKKRRDRPKRSLLDHLDHIRVNFRNPTQHPEARYDLDEAQDLLSLSIDATNRMVRDLWKRHLLEQPIPF